MRCPLCGQLNESVDLEETEGLVECSRCKIVFKVLSFTQDSNDNDCWFEIGLGKANETVKVL